MQQDDRFFLRSRDVDIAGLVDASGEDAAVRQRAQEIAVTSLPAAAPGDPALIAELYERPAAPPVFSGERIGLARLLRGPLRLFALWLFRIASVLDRRLNANRSGAFLELVREVDRLKNEVAAMRREVANLRAGSQARATDERSGT